MIILEDWLARKLAEAPIGKHIDYHTPLELIIVFNKLINKNVSNELFLFFTAVYLFPILRFLLIVTVAAFVYYLAIIISNKNKSYILININIEVIFIIMNVLAKSIP